MATRYYNFADGEYYHVYNRGNSKQTIFKNKSDYVRFLETLLIANSSLNFKLRDFSGVEIFDTEQKEPLVHIGAYCLMPNHFHLLITPAVDGGVPQFMLRVGTSYAAYFNKKYDRRGSLFEGSYQAKYVDSDRYLKYLFSYIHLNPFRTEAQRLVPDIASLKGYEYSSLPDYLGKERRQSRLLSRQKFPEYFKTKESQIYELYEWLDYQEM